MPIAIALIVGLVPLFGLTSSAHATESISRSDTTVQTAAVKRSLRTFRVGPANHTAVKQTLTGYWGYAVFPGWKWYNSPGLVYIAKEHANGRYTTWIRYHHLTKRPVKNYATDRIKCYRPWWDAAYKVYRMDCNKKRYYKKGIVVDAGWQQAIAFPYSEVW